MLFYTCSIVYRGTNRFWPAYNFYFFFFLDPTDAKENFPTVSRQITATDRRRLRGPLGPSKIFSRRLGGGFVPLRSP